MRTDYSPLDSRKNSRGSVLLMTLILFCFVSVLILTAADSLLLGQKAQQSLEKSTELFYLAEAGLAHGKALGRRCNDLDDFVALKEESKDGSEKEGTIKTKSPLYHWTAWGKGRYRLTPYVLKEKDSGVFVLQRDSGIVLLSTAMITGSNEKKELGLLVEEPPSCKTLAWWEPESICGIW